jgi:hypothetical protein
MEEWHDIVDKTKRYSNLTPSELRNVIVTILVLAFIIAFREFNLINIVSSLIIVSLSILIHLLAQRITGLSIGYLTEYKIWSFGLLFAIIVAFVSNGVVWLLIPGGIIIHHLAGHRIGFARYGLNYLGIGMIALWGSVASIFLAIFFKIVYAVFPLAILHKAMIFNIALAVYTMLPIPPLNGSRLFFGSRMIYIFSIASIGGGAILLVTNIPVIFSIVGALLIGLVCWLLYYIFFEKYAWPGPSPGLHSKKP